MRPRVFPAEDAGMSQRDAQRALWASMRPRVFPAEDLPGDLNKLRAEWGFNEAAGIPRGRRRTPRNPLRSKDVHHRIARGPAFLTHERG